LRNKLQTNLTQLVDDS